MNGINLADVITIVLAQMPVKSGTMLRTGAEFFDTPHELVVEYNTGALPYIIYQNEGFTHYLTKERVEVHKGFISNKTTGQLNAYGWSNSLGLPFDMQENNDAVLKNQDKMLEQLGVIENV